MPILLDKKLNTDFVQTIDNTEPEFKIHDPWRIITLLWSGGPVYLHDPESYAGGSLDSGRVTHARQVKG